MTPPIIMHVNYCEQGQTIEEMCRKAVDWGFDGIEFRRYRRGVDETPQEYLDAIAAGANKSGLKHVLFGGPGPDFMTSDESKRAAELSQAVDFYKEAAQRVELTVCNIMTGTLRSSDPDAPARAFHLHGSAAATDAHWRQATAGMKDLGKVASEIGFKFAFEVHMNYIHDTPDAAKKLTDMIDLTSVGINLDYGNVAYFPKAPSLAQSIEAAGEKLYLVHLKNSVKVDSDTRFAVGLGDGEINNREFVKTLKDKGYTGPICIEAPRPGDREWYAQQDLAYIKSVLKDLGW